MIYYSQDNAALHILSIIKKELRCDKYMTTDYYYQFGTWVLCGPSAYYFLNNLKQHQLIKELIHD